MKVLALKKLYELDMKLCGNVFLAYIEKMVVVSKLGSTETRKPKNTVNGNEIFKTNKRMHLMKDQIGNEEITPN